MERNIVSTVLPGAHRLSHCLPKPRQHQREITGLFLQALFPIRPQEGEVDLILCWKLVP